MLRRYRISLSAALLLALAAGCGSKPAPEDSASVPAGAPAAGDQRTADHRAPTALTPPQPPSAEEPNTEPAPTRNQAFDPATVGRINGFVKWIGDPPQPVKFVLDKDAHACTHDGRTEHVSQRLIVDPPTRGVKNAVVYLARMKGRGKPLDTLPYAGLLDQKHCEYSPRVMVIPRGAKLKMGSSDPTLHNVNMQGAAGYNMALLQGTQVSRPMLEPGLVRMKCDAGHWWMRGYLHVVEHPYYAITPADGRFELDDVPPGTYEVVMWHEGWSVIGQNAGRVEFSDEPLILKQRLTVRPKHTTDLNFELSDLHTIAARSS